ncbi:VanZ family protein [Rhodoferax sp.]|uniref:VanZ family protein n=1 Tax=Rhodoferax sp. TaxID=50421 RepID=UPI00374DD43A
MHKTSAWPLALLYIGLVVYASLYPFDGWRDQGIAPWFFITAPLPKYWTWFDVAINLSGYGPLGFLLALSALRTGRAGAPVLLATLAAGLLSLAMETLQSYLPVRVPSNVDWALNTAGALLGAITAALLERLGAIDRWSQFRARWFVADARGELVLLALWPVALLFPAAVPLGLGQVLERLEAGLADALEDTPFLDWLPVRDVELQPLVPSAELLCVALGALIPCLLGYCVVRRVGQRAVFALTMLALGLGAAAVSAGLSYGPNHALDWLSLPVRVGLWTGLALAAALVWLPRRFCAPLVLLALALHLGMLNQAPASAYFAQTLHTWEQGKFIRFQGLVQWLGWLWPYAALAVVVGRIARPAAET